MLFIEPFSKPYRIAIAITITSLIIVIFLLVGHGTAYGSVPKPDRGFDLAAGHDKPEGAWSNNNNIWVVSEDDDKLYAYSLATGARVEDRDIELSGGNDDPQGIVARDSIMFVADWDDTKLYAYRLSDGQRLPNRDINLADANDAPRGISIMYGNIIVVDKDTERRRYLATLTKCSLAYWDFWKCRRPATRSGVTELTREIGYWFVSSFSGWPSDCAPSGRLVAD